MQTQDRLDLDASLDLFLSDRAQARRFHAGNIGRNVDPQHCLGDFLCRVRSKDVVGIAKNYFPEVKKAASLSELQGEQGGYLVPQELSDNILCDLSTRSLWRRSGAHVQPMQSATMVLPVPDVTQAYEAGVAPFFGGLQFKWLSDGAEFSKTTPRFRDLELVANILGGYLYVSNPMLEDARGIEGWLTRLLSDGLAWYQDWSFFQGDGVGQPQGVIGSASALTIDRAAANKIAAADAQAMMAALLPSALDDGGIGACWFCHPTTLAQLTAFTGWIPNGPLTLYGLPVIPTGKCSTLGSRGDLVLASPRCYVIGDRLRIEIAYSPYEPTAFLSNKSAFRVYCRVAGQPMTAAPITLSDGASRVSPFVVLN